MAEGMDGDADRIAAVGIVRQQRTEIGEAPRIARPEQRAVERADEVKKIVREPGGAQQDGRRVGRGDGKIARDVRRGSGVWRHGARGKAQRARRVGRGDAPVAVEIARLRRPLVRRARAGAARGKEQQRKQERPRPPRPPGMCNRRQVHGQSPKTRGAQGARPSPYFVT